MLKLNFGKNKITTGSVHTFLITYYFDDGTFGIDMSPHLKQTIEEFGEDVIAASTPARSDLFFFDESKPLVDERSFKLFHRTVCRLIYCTCRGRKDLQTLISFLSKRRLACNEHDYGKLWRLVHYTHGTMDAEDIIGMKDLGRMVTFVDASCAVHANMRSHTGAAIHSA